MKNKKDEELQAILLTCDGEGKATKLEALQELRKRYFELAKQYFKHLEHLDQQDQYMDYLEYLYDCANETLDQPVESVEAKTPDPFQNKYDIEKLRKEFLEGL